MSEAAAAPDSDLVLVERLDELESRILRTALRWWHLVAWWRSPARSLRRQFSDLELRARVCMKAIRDMRDRVLAETSERGRARDFLVFPAAYLGLSDREAALSTRIERSRFLLVSLEGEEHAKRSVLFGALGVLRGFVGVVLGALSLK